MRNSDQDPQWAMTAQSADDHPLLALATKHLEMATRGLMSGQFNPFREVRDPTRMLVVYRRRYGAGVGDEYLVAQPTYITEPSGRHLRPGETIVLDFDGKPAVAIVEALLYRGLLEDDPAAQELVSRYLANHG